MECIKAQELVSEALDNASVDAHALAQAKEHCRQCPECREFVRTLVALQRSPLPSVPHGLPERIMQVVTAEQARAQRAAAAIASASAITEAAAPEVSHGTTQEDAEPTVSLMERIRDPRHRRALVSWSAAAAVVFIAAGFGAVAGVRAMFDTGDRNQVASSGSIPQGAAPAGTVASPESQPSTADSTAAKSSEDVSFVGMIVVSGTVYRTAGTDSSVTEQSLSRIGSARTSLNTGQAPADEPVLGTSDPSRVFIKGTDGAMLAFDRVTLSYQGRTYALQSGAIDEYGSAATLPAGLTEPASSDGSPTFEAVDDSAGTGVFIQKGRDANTGIAFGEGKQPEFSDGWTWWTPLPQ